MAEADPIRVDHISSTAGGIKVEATYQKFLFRMRLNKADFEDNPHIHHCINVATNSRIGPRKPEKNESWASVSRYCQEICGPKIRSLSADVPTPSSSGTIEELVCPVTFDIQLSSTRDEPQKVNVLPPEQYAHQTRFAETVLSELEKYDYKLIPAAELIILESLSYKNLQKVLWNDGTYIFKAANAGCRYSLEREIEIYMALNAIQDEEDIKLHVPRCYGIVTSNDKVVGLLLQYIGDSDTLASKRNLRAPEEQKRQWLDQIHTLINKFHANDIVWGDVKTENVVIDSSGNAWLLDFGGGATKGWVDSDKTETVEGDLQGLGRIEDALELEGSSEGSPAREGA